MYTGKVIDVRRYIGDGYTRGTVIFAPFSDSERNSTAATAQSSVPSDRHMVVPFQNEYLYAALSDSGDLKNYWR
jgi:DUF917 family protein